jgi:hypothetical protein
MVAIVVYHLDALAGHILTAVSTEDAVVQYPHLLSNYRMITLFPHKERNLTPTAMVHILLKQVSLQSPVIKWLSLPSNDVCGRLNALFMSKKHRQMGQ